MDELQRKWLIKCNKNQLIELIEYLTSRHSSCSWDLTNYINNQREINLKDLSDEADRLNHLAADERKKYLSIIAPCGVKVPILPAEKLNEALNHLEAAKSYDKQWERIMEKIDRGDVS